jgi:hypothetical protein
LCDLHQMMDTNVELCSPEELIQSVKQTPTEKWAVPPNDSVQNCICCSTYWTHRYLILSWNSSLFSSLFPTTWISQEKIQHKSCPACVGHGTSEVKSSELQRLHPEQIANAWLPTQK